MGNPYIGDLVEMVVDGNAITSGRTVSGNANMKMITAPATWSNPEVDIPGSTRYTYTIECVDDDDNSGTDFDVLQTIARAKLPVTVVIYPRGNVAGRKIISGSAYIGEPIRNLSMDAATTYSFTVSFTDVPTETANLKLAATNLGQTGVGDASAYAALSASGGTATYSYAIVRGVLPEGISVNSAGVASGTVDAAANIGEYLVDVEITDSAATPIVKVIQCVYEVVA